MQISHAILALISPALLASVAGAVALPSYEPLIFAPKVAGSGGAVSEEETDDYDDEEAGDPCPDDPMKDLGGGLPLVGPGMFLNVTNGKIWFEVPILKTYAGGEVEFDLRLRYESDNPRDIGLGPGWTHNYYRGLLPDFSNDGVVYIDETGRRHHFALNQSGNDGSYVTPPGRSTRFTHIDEHPNPPFSVLRQPNGDKIRWDDGLVSLTKYYEGTTTVEHETLPGNPPTPTIITSPYGNTISMVPGTETLVITGRDPANITTLNFDVDGNLVEIVDQNGDALQYVYAGGGRMTKETLRNGKYYTATYTTGPGQEEETTTIFDMNGSVVVSASCPSGFPDTDQELIEEADVTVTDGNGRETIYHHDSVGRIRSIEYPSHSQPFPGGPPQTPGGAPQEIPGLTESFVYGGVNGGFNRNRIIQRVDRAGNTTSFNWNEQGAVTDITDAALNTTQYEYEYLLDTNPDFLGNYVTKVIEPDGDPWEYSYHDHSSRVEDMTDPYNNVHHTDWDWNFQPSSGHLWSETRTDRTGARHEFDYDNDSGDLDTYTRNMDGLGAANELPVVTRYESDLFGRINKFIEERGDRDVVTDVTYDEHGQRRSVVRDPGGLALTTLYDYDGHGNLTKVTDPKGITTEYVYDDRNALEQEIHDSVTGGLNITTTYERDGEQNITKEITPRGHTYTYWYDQYNRLERIEDPGGYNTYIRRDAMGNVVWTTRTVNPGETGPFIEVQFKYDVLNRMTERIEAPLTLALTTLYEYGDPASCGCAPSPEKSLVRKVTDPSQHVTYFEYDKLDRLTEIIRKVGGTEATPDANDAVTTFTYDATGNRKTAVGPEGETTEYDYDGAHRLWKSRVIDQSGSGDLETEYRYDGSNNLTKLIPPQGLPQNYVYDGANRLEEVNDTTIRRTYQYDENGNVLVAGTAITDQDYVYTYDTLNRLKTALAPENAIGAPTPTTYAYDANSNLIDVIAPSTTVTRRSYDSLDRMTKRTDDFLPPPALQQPGPYPNTTNTFTTWIYDGVSLTGFEDHAENRTTYAYDEALRLLSTTQPDGVQSRSWTYNQDGTALTRTDENNIVTTYAYDDLKSLTQRTYSTGRSETFTFDKSGRPITGSNSHTDTTLDYDAVGRLKSEKYKFLADNVTYETTRTYSNAVGLPQVTTYQGGRAVTHTVDDRQRLSLVDGGAGVSKLLAYDDADRLIGATLGNGVVSVFGWDLNNRVTSIDHQKGQAALFDVDYGYDVDGYRLWSLDSLRSDHSELIEYDRLNRVRRVERGNLDANAAAITQRLDSPDMPSLRRWARLDRRGNWKRVWTGYGSDPQVREERTVNTSNEYLTIDPDGPRLDDDPELPLGADANGNLLTDPLVDIDGLPGREGQVYTYDEENRLTSVTNGAGTPLLDIFYDAFGTRVESVDHTGSTSTCASGVTTTRQVAFDGATVQEHQACGSGPGFSWDLARELIWGASFIDPVAIVDRTDLGDEAAGMPEVLHYLTDALGSVVALTDELGVSRERYDYTAYGETFVSDPVTDTTLASSAYGNPIAWAGQRLDYGVEIYHFLFRSYSTHLGRWMQRDPLGFIDGPNLREYAFSSPLRFTDPMGLQGHGGYRSSEAYSSFGSGAQAFVNDAVAGVVGLFVDDAKAAGASVVADVTAAAVAVADAAITYGPYLASTAFEMTTVGGLNAARLEFLDGNYGMGAFMLTTSGVGGGGWGSAAKWGKGLGLDWLDPAHLAHLFGPKKKGAINALAKALGSESCAAKALQEAAQAYVDAGGPLDQGAFEFATNIAGEALTIRGQVVDGIARVGTAFR